jgi:hypothetical protein
MIRRMRVAASLIVAATWLSAGPAEAHSDAVACARASESAQSLRSAGKLVEALDRVPACLHLRCPDFVRRDCEALRTDVQASLPTIVVRARAPGGEDTTDVRVLVDGVPFLDRLDGRAKPVDPGPHTLRFEMSGADPIETSVVVREGEKMRIVDAAFTTPARAASTGKHEEAAAKPRSFPWPAAIVAGAGVVALGAFAYLGLTGLSDYHALQAGCGSNGSCHPSDVDPVRTKLWVADGLGVAGVAALGAAAWIWISSRGTARAAVAPTAGGARAVVALSF